MNPASTGRAMRVVKVESKNDLRRFTRFPWSIYRGVSQWVPPLFVDVETRLSRTKNPFFQHAEADYFLALRGDEVVGRISASVDHNYNAFWNEKAGAFGWFECIDEPAVARALVDTARDWLRARGASVMRGPLSFSTNDECGLLIDGFDQQPAVLMPYNPPSYASLLEAAGLRKAKDLYAFWLSASQEPPERIARMSQIVRERKGVRIRPLNMKEFPAEVERVKQVYNAAWEKNWGFVPMTDAEFAHMAKDLKLGVDPAMVHFAEIDGEVVGSTVILPDLNEATKHANGRLLPFGLIKILWHKPRVKRLRLLTLGVRQEYRQRGIEAALIVEALMAARRRGYSGGELSWVLEDNVRILRPIEEMGATRTKTYRIYETAV
jgi:GNAT superfamily N-acetyltransferase